MDFKSFKARYPWKPIPRCPGRFILTTRGIGFTGLIRQPGGFRVMLSDKVPDPVFLFPFKDGGIISYFTKNNTFLHTLGTLEGFRRKLEALENKEHK